MSIQTIANAVGNALGTETSPVLQQYTLYDLAKRQSFYIAPEDAKIFSIWCPWKGNLKRVSEQMKAMSDFLQVEQTEEAEANNKTEIDNGGEENKAARTKENTDARIAKQFSQAATYIQSLSNESDLPWCKASVGNPWDSNQAITPAIMLTKGWKMEFPFTSSETQVFCGQLSAWTETLQHILPQEVEYQIRDQYALNGGKLSDAEKATFNSLLYYCRQSFAIDCNSQNDTCTIYSSPIDICTAAMKMVAPEEKAKEPSTAWSWDSDSAKESGPIKKMEDTINKYLRGKDMSFWGELEGFCKPISDRPWYSKAAYLLGTHIVSLSFMTILTFAAMREQFIFRIFLKKFLNPVEVFGWKTVAKRVWRIMKKWFKGPPKGPQGGSPVAGDPKGIPVPIPVPEKVPEAAPKLFTPIQLNLPYGASSKGWNYAVDTAVSGVSVFTKVGLGIAAAAASVAAVASVADNAVGVVGDEAIAVPAATAAWRGFLTACGL